jgi:type IV secretory pathway VirB2 component (pilin)
VSDESTAPITAPSFVETSEFALSVAVVDTHSLAGAGNHCVGSVLSTLNQILHGKTQTAYAVTRIYVFELPVSSLI